MGFMQKIGLRRKPQPTVDQTPPPGQGSGSGPSRQAGTQNPPTPLPNRLPTSQSMIGPGGSSLRPERSSHADPKRKFWQPKPSNTSAHQMAGNAFNKDQTYMNKKEAANAVFDKNHSKKIPPQTPRVGFNPDVAEHTLTPNAPPNQTPLGQIQTSGTRLPTTAPTPDQGLYHYPVEPDAYGLHPEPSRNAVPQRPFSSRPPEERMVMNTPPRGSIDYSNAPTNRPPGVPPRASREGSDVGSSQGSV